MERHMTIPHYLVLTLARGSPQIINRAQMLGAQFFPGHNTGLGTSACLEIVKSILNYFQKILLNIFF